MQVMKAAEVAQLLRCSPSTVRRLSKLGQMPAMRFGSKDYRYDRETIERWTHSRRADVRVSK